MSNHEETKFPKLSINALPGDDWETRLSKQVARNISFYKYLQKLTTKQLAEICNEIYKGNGEIKVPTLNGLFHGKRKSISIGEIMVFARALKVAPIMLMLPVATAEDIEIVPGETVEPLEAYKYITAADRRNRTDDGTGSYRYAKDFEDSAWYEPLWILQRHDDLLDGLERVYVVYAAGLRLKNLLSPEAIKESKERVNNSLENLSSVRRRATELGLALPRVPSSIENHVNRIPVSEIDGEIVWPELEDRIEKAASGLLKQWNK